MLLFTCKDARKGEVWHYVREMLLRKANSPWMPWPKKCTRKASLASSRQRIRCCRSPGHAKFSFVSLLFRHRAHFCLACLSSSLHRTTIPRTPHQSISRKHRTETQAGNMTTQQPKAPSPVPHGRGGAGNISSKSNKAVGAEDLQTPTIKTSTYTTGRGGNCHHHPSKYRKR